MGDIHHLCNGDDRNETTIDMCFGCGSIWESSHQSFFSLSVLGLLLLIQMLHVWNICFCPLHSTSSYEMQQEGPKVGRGAMFGYSPENKP